MNKKPNILWILAEDIGCHQGCYGDLNAKTPNIDLFAKESIRFTNASSCAPVCSAARSTLIMGMLGSTIGVGDHRGHAVRPDFAKIFPYHLKQAGYYTAIGKTDFNFDLNADEEFDDYIPAELDEDSADFAVRLRNSYLKREDDKPFFMMHTILCTHQSQYGYSNTANQHRVSMPRIQESEYCDRNSIVVPKYHYDTKSTREMWAQYHEKMTTMDKMFGEVIDKLKKDNLYEDTIIFFFGDNGHGIPSGKCNLWKDGTHVPLIMRLPDKYKKQINLETYSDNNGEVCSEHVSFIDLAPTIFDMAEVKKPTQFQGKSFCEEKTNERAVLSFCDRIEVNGEGYRSYGKGEYFYMRNFAITDNYNLISYAISHSSWLSEENVRMATKDKTNNGDRRLLFCGAERKHEHLFNTQTDKFQMNNLADNEDYNSKINEMRDSLFAEILKLRDRALMPECVLYGMCEEHGKIAYDIISSDDYYPLTELIELEKRFDEKLIQKQDYENLLKDDRVCIKLWALRKGYKLISNQLLQNMLCDQNESIKVYTACLLIKKNECLELAEKTIIEVVGNTSNAALLLFVCNILKELPCKQENILDEIVYRLNENNIQGNNRLVGTIRNSVDYISKKIGAPLKLNDHTRGWSEEVDKQIDKYLEALSEYKNLSVATQSDVKCNGLATYE